MTTAAPKGKTKSLLVRHLFALVPNIINMIQLLAVCDPTLFVTETKPKIIG